MGFAVLEVREKYVFILISDETPEKVKEFINANNYDFEFVLTQNNIKSIIGVFPTTFILDEEQNIIYRNAGSFEDYSKSDLLEIFNKR